MKTNNMLKAACLMLMATATPSAFAQKMNIEHKGDTTIVKVENPTKYLLLPIQEEKDEAQVILSTGDKEDTWMDVRLAQNGVDYFVPFSLEKNAAGKSVKGNVATVKILGLKKDALAVNLMKLSNTFDTTNTDYYRPSYHFTPLYGWMNDPNGMVYKDGEYHLYFQYNPYGSKWGNMHWGHAVSKDLVHWEHLDPAIARDPVGHIFSGSSVIDKKNTAGFGKDAIIAIYTNNSVNHDEVQCIAYSNDNGRTFTKYEGNPVLTPFDGLKDFRDPKVFWYEKGKCWYMIVSADKEMRLYKSKNLKKWNYVSAFGKGIGQQPCQYECPDFFQLPVNGDKKKMKWVMTMNINPGCWFGGSATEYFVGDFDGKKFTCPDANEVKWLDWGKDHYATVTFSNTGDRVLGITWMSNWQYANLTPFKQNRGANGLPRELKLYEKNGKYYISEDVAPEVYALRKDTKNVADASVAGEKMLAGVAANMEGAFEIEADVTPDANGIAGIEISNNKRERTMIYFDMKQGKVVMDRTESGLSDFGKQAVPHDIELAWDKQLAAEGKQPARITNSINYKNDFALATWAPLSLCEDGKKTYHVDIFVDKSSVELFVDGGRIAMTNLVFPVAPYENVKLYTQGGKAEFKNLKVHKLGL
ncbi:GH32 C-terminal domain-containing protein [Segatella copri]|uniref:GH32 C-terminal domain-containing protein n=1 Tax=Segatella copri TaxID=165179 RepID=UPI0025F17248|nr:GH32 C-terminal domain-containing protein [Segatella copri]